MTSESGPYADTVGDDGRIEYSYANGPIDNHFNEALRNAYRYRRPVIYLCRLQKGVFEAFHPVFIEADEPGRRTVSVAIDTPGLGEQGMRSGGSPEMLKRYATVEALKRLHQEQFRFQVVGAYRRACTVCSLGDEDRLVRLLDAAHILPDGDPRSQPVVSNGLSLCKIHHSAYDLNILGDQSGLSACISARTSSRKRTARCCSMGSRRWMGGRLGFRAGGVQAESGVPRGEVRGV